MLDRETGSVWTHLDGKAIQGPLAGKRMIIFPTLQMTWGEWKGLHPDTKVLSPDTPFRERYRSVSVGSFNSREALIGDDRLDSNTLVVGVEVDGQFKGYPLKELEAAGGVVNDLLAGQPILVIYDKTAETGLAYSRVLGDQVFSFYNGEPGGFEVLDRETDSSWDTHGGAVSGPLAGESLEFVSSFISEWYGWSGYHPDTALFAADR